MAETAATATPSIADQMRAALQEDSGADGASNELGALDPSAKPGPAGAAEGTDDTSDVQEEGSQEAGEASEKDAKKAEDAKKEEEKSSSYKRLQKKLEAERGATAKAKTESVEALRIANQWRQRALTLQREMQRMASEASRTGYRRDPRDDRMLALELQQRDFEVERGMAQHVQQAQFQQAIDQKADAYTEQAGDLVTRYPGLTQGEILRAYAAMVESSGEEVPMDEVASLLHARKKGRGPGAQMQKNRSAPRPIAARPMSRPPDFSKPTTDNMKAYLQSIGQA